MVISGLLSVEDLGEDLETRAKNLLKQNIANKNGFSHSIGLSEEIEFLVNQKYLAQKEGLPFLEYEITSKGREYSKQD